MSLAEIIAATTPSIGLLKMVIGRLDYSVPIAIFVAIMHNASLSQENG